MFTMSETERAQGSRERPKLAEENPHLEYQILRKNHADLLVRANSLMHRLPPERRKAWIKKLGLNEKQILDEKVSNNYATTTYEQQYADLFARNDKLADEARLIASCANGYEEADCFHRAVYRLEPTDPEMLRKNLHKSGIRLERIVDNHKREVSKSRLKTSQRHSRYKTLKKDHAEVGNNLQFDRKAVLQAAEKSEAVLVRKKTIEKRLDVTKLALATTPAPPPIESYLPEDASYQVKDFVKIITTMQNLLREQLALNSSYITLMEFMQSQKRLCEQQKKARALLLEAVTRGFDFRDGHPQSHKRDGRRGAIAIALKNKKQYSLKEIQQTIAVDPDEADFITRLYVHKFEESYRKMMQVYGFTLDLQSHCRLRDTTSCAEQVLSCMRQRLLCHRARIWVVNSLEEYFQDVCDGEKRPYVGATRDPYLGQMWDNRHDSDFVLNVRDAYMDPTFERWRDKQTMHRTRAVLMVPIFAEGRMVAVLHAVNKTELREEEAGFTKEDERMFRILGSTFRNIWVHFYTFVHIDFRFSFQIQKLLHNYRRIATKSKPAAKNFPDVSKPPSLPPLPCLMKCTPQNFSYAFLHFCIDFFTFVLIVS